MSPKLYYFFSGFSAFDYGTAGIAGNLNLRYSLQLYERPTNVFPRSVWNNVYQILQIPILYLIYYKRISVRFIYGNHYHELY